MPVAVGGRAAAVLLIGVAGTVMVMSWGDDDVPFDESRAPIGFLVSVASAGLVGAGGGLLVIRWRRVWSP
jgi:hypothetical protein